MYQAYSGLYQTASHYTPTNHKGWRRLLLRAPVVSLNHHGRSQSIATESSQHWTLKANEKLDSDAKLLYRIEILSVRSSSKADSKAFQMYIPNRSFCFYPSVLTADVNTAHCVYVKRLGCFRSWFRIIRGINSAIPTFHFSI